VNAAALVGAGVVSVLIFPTVALGLLRDPDAGSSSPRPEVPGRDVSTQPSTQPSTEPL
jgi:hypothetical protein